VRLTFGGRKICVAEIGFGRLKISQRAEPYATKACGLASLAGYRTPAVDQRLSRSPLGGVDSLERTL